MHFLRNKTQKAFSIVLVLSLFFNFATKYGCMTTRNERYFTYPSSQKIYVTDANNRVKVGMRQIVLHDAASSIQGKNSKPVTVYDTSGAYSDPDIEIGDSLPRVREVWFEGRRDLRKDEANVYSSKEGKVATQLYYAKKRVVTPEMEYVAIRENQQIEMLGLRTYITPEFVRKEIASGHAVLPANLNHLEEEPMILGRRFRVKCAASAVNLDDVQNACKWGADLLFGQYQTALPSNLTHMCPVPLCSSPLCDTLQSLSLDFSQLSWEKVRDTMEQEARQGVDLFIIHAGLLQNLINRTAFRLTGIVSCGGRIMANWMQIYKKENFLFTHFDELCELMRSYDVTLALSLSLRPGSVYDASDASVQMEIKNVCELAERAREQCVQVAIEAPGHLPMHKIHESMKEFHYSTSNVPAFTISPMCTDVAPGYESFSSAIGGALSGCYGSSLLSMDIPRIGEVRPQAKEIRSQIMSLRIAAHAADLAKAHPGAQVLDNAICKARSEGRIKDLAHLSFDPWQAARSISVE